MSFYPWWPPVAALVMLFSLSATRVLGSLAPLKVAREARSRGIDGLRGLLALAVVMLHGAIYHRYSLDGIWSAPPSTTYILFGTGGVAVFFMITGYLFTGKLIDDHGRIDWTGLYLGRLFRIGPLYLVAVALMLLLVMEQAGWRLLVTPGQLAAQIAPWLAFGVLDPTDVNGHVATLVLTAGVTWSLRYEWLFYLALPLLACVAGPGRLRCAALLLAMLAGFAWSMRGGPVLLNAGDPAYATLFLIGGATAAVHRRFPGFSIGDGAGSSAMLLLLGLLFWRCSIGFSPLAMALLGSCFFLVATGCTMFGLLVHPAARRLGEISYGIYLLQGIVLAFLFQFEPVRRFAMISPLQHWSVVLAAVLLLGLLAAALHALIEQPGIRLGRRLTSRRGLAVATEPASRISPNRP